MSVLHFTGPDGTLIPVTAATPLPTGAGGAAVPTAWGTIEGTIADQADLTTALAGKATTAQGAKADTAVQPAALTSGLAAKADTTALTSGLAGKAATSHTHTYASLTAKPVATYVDPATGTIADVVNALIAAGLMAAA